MELEGYKPKRKVAFNRGDPIEAEEAAYKKSIGNEGGSDSSTDTEEEE